MNVDGARGTNVDTMQTEGCLGCERRCRGHEWCNPWCEMVWGVWQMERGASFTLRKGD